MDWEQFKRTMGSARDWRVLAEFMGITVAVPALIYWLLTRHFSVDTPGEELLCGFLGLAGLIAFGVLRWRY